MRLLANAFPAHSGRLAAALVTALLVALTTSCGGGETIQIGFAAPVKQPRGISMEQGARLAIDEINKAGGVDGRLLELVVRDDEGTEQKAIEVAEELRSNRAVVAVIGHLNSGPTIVAGRIYGAGDDPIVAISPSASSPAVTGIGPWMYRVCPADGEHGSAIARYIAANLQRRRVAVIYLNDAYGRGVFDAFRTEFARIDGTQITPYPVGAGIDADIVAEHVATISRAEAIVLATDRATAVPLLRAMRARGITLPILGGDGLTGIEAEGAIAEGVYVSASYLAQRPGAQNAEFVGAYGTAFGGAIPDHRSAGAYDAVHLLARVIADAGASRDGIRRALDRVTGELAFSGVTGSIKFDANGDAAEKTVLIGVIRAGRLQYAEGQ
jgi:branched-chain amino acid transport system substrate-binding protein